jgi:RNA polymerase sigma factor (sigma-70 family)
MAGIDDEEIFQAAQRGDPRAIGDLYTWLRERLLPRIARRVGPAIDAEDVFEDTFIHLFDKFVKFRTRPQILAYAGRSAFHLVSHEARSSSHRRSLESLPDPGTWPWPPDGPSLEFIESLEAVRRHLDPIDLELFDLLFLEEEAEAEVAARLGMTCNAVACRKRRLRVKLREWGGFFCL